MQRAPAKRRYVSELLQASAPTPFYESTETSANIRDAAPMCTHASRPCWLALLTGVRPYPTTSDEPNAAVMP